MSSINDVVVYDIEPYEFIDNVSSTTKYIGTSMSYGDGSKPVWRIKKVWVVGNVQYMGFPNGDQSYGFVWNDRALYNYK